MSTTFAALNLEAFVVSVPMEGRSASMSANAHARLEAVGDAATRMLDVMISVIALLFFAPLMVVLAALVRVSGGPILFRQRRVGRDGKVFVCLKFRTMHVDADLILDELLRSDPVARAEWERDRKLRVDPRVIRFASFMRKASLDELPQLFNVLAGSMSIVGPRPIVPSESGKYGRYFAHYCRVRPGITGLWQISGRNSTTYRRRVACDVAYVRNKSSFRDAQIIMKTIPAVCFARGAY